MLWPNHATFSLPMQGACASTGGISLPPLISIQPGPPVLCSGRHRSDPGDSASARGTGLTCSLAFPINNSRRLTSCQTVCGLQLSLNPLVKCFPPPFPLHHMLAGICTRLSRFSECGHEHVGTSSAGTSA